MDDTTIVRVDTPVIPGVKKNEIFAVIYLEEHVHKSRVYVDETTSLYKRQRDQKRIVVPLLDISLALSAKRPCCPSSLFGCNAMAASAKSACARTWKK
jgi:hypothetical protein